MAKLVFVFIAVFLLVQFSLAETREKREDETTTQNILESIKTGIEQAFSEQNIKTAIDNINEFGEKVKELGKKAVTNLQSAMKPDETTPKAA